VAGAAVRRDAGALVECRPPTGTPDGAEVAVTVRPERLRVGDAPAGGTALKGTVVDRVYLGAGTKVLVDAGAGTVLTVLEPPDIDAADRPPVGGAVTVWWEPRHARCLA
jgi:ABC-type Fe3+/spermidine/putrescine transport system ATPase subunit